MLVKHLHESRGARARGRARTLCAALLAAAALVALGAPAPALAGLEQELSVFGACPVNTSGVNTCVYSTVTGGEFTLGSKTVHIDKTIVLQGGINTGGELVAATNGETLSKTPLTVPGGLVGIEGLGGEVTATAELAGTVKLSAINLLEGKGTAVSLPLKVKLGNPLLGESCFIGENSQPVLVPLTTGTTSPPSPNEPITGNPGHLELTAGGRIDVIPGSSLVENAFSVPGANGCGGLLALVIDPLVDLSAGLPAAGGHNTAIMDGTLKVALAAVVKHELALPELGRCVPAETVGEGKQKLYEGAYGNHGCTEEVGTGGKYEWHSGPGAKRRFTSKGGKTTLESVNGTKVQCAGSSVAGEYTGAKTLSAVVTFDGCVRAASRESCQSAKAPAGEIVTSTLSGELGFIQDEVVGESSALVVSVGLDLGHEPSLLSAECGGASEALVVRGSVIAPIGKANKMSPSFSLKFKQATGKQQPEGFEGHTPDTLSATLGHGSEQVGLSATEKLAGEEPLEIKSEYAT
jgi:hypothetical protein